MASVHAATKGLSTMHSAWHIALSVVLLASLPAAVAHAEKPASSGKEQKAKHHFHVAQTFKELGEYDKAAEEFLKAYELYKDPAFFFNAGEMYRLAGNHKPAVTSFSSIWSSTRMDGSPRQRRAPSGSFSQRRISRSRKRSSLAS